MDMYISLNQKLQQKQIMTQKMIQAINILKMDSQELNSYIEEEYQNNPIIEIENKHVTDWEKYSLNKRSYSSIKNINIESKDINKEVLVSSTDNWISDLLTQWNSFKTTSKENIIGKFLIYNTNNKGYLDICLEDVAKYYNTNVNEVEEILKKVQQIEPSGIVCRNINERLLVQLRNKGVKDDKLELIISDYLELVANNQLKSISKKLNISLEKLKEYIKIIQSLNPVLSLDDNNPITYVQPEIKVTENNGKFELEYLNNRILEVNICKNYQEILHNKNVDEKTKEYVKSNLDKAVWLIKSIEERKNNIINISNCIIERQKDFLINGKSYLRPYTQKEIAYDLNISESTVSRIVNGKYIDTPQGIYELKFFFSSSIGNNGDDFSSKAIKDQINEIIMNEDKSKPLSDEKIRKILSQRGINISRRTVAKYRLDLGILGTIQRKEI